MPWKECNRMDERLRFVARLLDGEKMAVVCQEFGISRKTGYKIFNRYKEFGLDGLTDRSRAPHRHPNKLPFQIETAILRIKREHTVVRIGVAGLFIGNTAEAILEQIECSVLAVKPEGFETPVSLEDRHD